MASCAFCLERYDDGSRCPHLLLCGHGMCALCMRKTQGSPVCCPFDNQETTGSLPKNHGLLENLRVSSELAAKVASLKAALTAKEEQLEKALRRAAETEREASRVLSEAQAELEENLKAMETKSREWSGLAAERDRLAQRLQRAEQEAMQCSAENMRLLKKNLELDKEVERLVRLLADAKEKLALAEFTKEGSFIERHNREVELQHDMSLVSIQQVVELKMQLANKTYENEELRRCSLTNPPTPSSSSNGPE